MHSPSYSLESPRVITWILTCSKLLMNLRMCAVTFIYCIIHYSKRWLYGRNDNRNVHIINSIFV